MRSASGVAAASAPSRPVVATPASTATGPSVGAPRTSHQPQASATAAPASAGRISRRNQAGCTARATSRTCSKVATQDSSPAPAISRASERPSRTAMPMLATVAVLETKPDAIADRATAWRASSRRRLRCASAWINSSSVSSCVIWCGLSIWPQNGRSGIKGNAISASAASRMPSRTSAGRSQLLAKACRRSRANRMPVWPTATAAASGRLRMQSTPIR